MHLILLNLVHMNIHIQCKKIEIEYCVYFVCNLIQSKMLLERVSKITSPRAYNIIRYPIIDSFSDKRVEWMRFDHIPWHQNPHVIWESEAIKSGKIKYGKRKAYEWRYKGGIYHRDVFNNIWQKKEGKMIWIGIYLPDLDIIDYTISEPK